MSETVLLELALVIGIAAVLALVGRAIKQPTIIAYLITGILVGPFAFDVLSQTEIVNTLARMGVAFLLFIVGLNLDFRVLKEVGGVSVVVGVGQVVIASTLGFFIALGFGFAYIPAFYLAAALAFSSTVVVVKLLSDKNELDTLHGKIAIGVLIVQDFIAAFVLMIVPVIGGGDISLIFIQLGKAALLIIGMFVFSYVALPGAFSIAAKNQEVLFLLSIAWALLIAIVFDSLGFSLEIGALLAGMALASSKYNLEIRGKIKGLRDFFVVLFFVFFGAQLVRPVTASLIMQAAVFSLLILIGTPIIVMTLMKLFGYKKQTSFFTGINIAQISEFSLILILLGFNLGIVEREIFSLTILIALMTIALSSYTIYYARPIYKVLSRLLNIFDGKGKHFNAAKKEENYEIILFGYNRIGFNLLKAFDKAKKKYVVIDYNPKTITDLSNKGISCIYGDANDVDFLEDLNLNKKKLIISTIPLIDINLTILRSIRNKSIIFIPTAHSIAEARKLYRAGASYVIMPHFLGGNFMANILVKDNFDKKLLSEEGKKQIKELQERMFEGHEHPRKDHHGA